jgi:hypothetical protein
VSYDRVLFAVGLGMSPAAQTTPSEAGHCAGLPSFGPQDSLNSADLRVENKDLRVQVNAKGPELHVRLEPDPEQKSPTDAVQRVGWIRTFSCETPWCSRWRSGACPIRNCFSDFSR